MLTGWRSRVPGRAVSAAVRHRIAGKARPCPLDDALRDLAASGNAPSSPTEQAHLLGCRARVAPSPDANTAHLQSGSPRCSTASAVCAHRLDMLRSRPQCARVRRPMPPSARRVLQRHWLPGFRLEPIHVAPLSGTATSGRRASRRCTPPRALPSTQLVDRRRDSRSRHRRGRCSIWRRGIHWSASSACSIGRGRDRLVNWHLMHRTFSELTAARTTGHRRHARAVSMNDLPTTCHRRADLEAQFQEAASGRRTAGDGAPGELGDDARWLGRVDFLDRERKVIVEVQSDLHHTQHQRSARRRPAPSATRRDGGMGCGRDSRVRAMAPAGPSEATQREHAAVWPHELQPNGRHSDQFRCRTGQWVVGGSSRLGVSGGGSRRWIRAR